MKLKCAQHRRRVQTGDLHVLLHREDGAACDSVNVTLGRNIMPATIVAPGEVRPDGARFGEPYLPPRDRETSLLREIFTGGTA